MLQNRADVGDTLAQHGGVVGESDGLKLRVVLSVATADQAGIDRLSRSPCC
jgi:hypothetical protein